MPFVARTDFQKMAEEKLVDAALLLENGRHSNAYYLAGYAVEFGLKAAICKQMLPECLPDWNLIRNVYQHGHNLNALVALAGLSEELKAAEADPVFKGRWSTVIEWSEAARYEIIEEFRAVALLHAIDDPKDGVMQWLTRRWYVNIREGREFVALLDRIGVPVKAALWLHDPDNERWRLVIVTEEAAKGLIDLYVKVIEAGAAIDVSNVEFQTPSRPLYGALRKLKNVNDGRRISTTMVGGVYIDDAFIYRVEP